MEPEWKMVGVTLRIVIGKLTGKIPLGWPGYRWEDNIRIDLKEIGVNRRTGLIRFRIGIIGNPL